jgi:SAM-dependent methyltransferase
MMKHLRRAFGHSILKGAGWLGNPLVARLSRRVNAFVRKLTASGHRLQMQIDWSLPSRPEWHDHYLDLCYQWHDRRTAFWVERGCFSLLALNDQARVLELCCGEGFNACHFYSTKADRIVAVDFDPYAIWHAREFNAAANVTFEVCDIRSRIPDGPFDNIIWDAAIEHFTSEEIASIMRSIEEQLRPLGLLTGYTIVEQSGGKQLTHHEYEFKSKDLLHFLSPHFKNVKVFETIYPSRHNLYFCASDGVLPFDPGWKFQTVQSRC